MVTSEANDFVSLTIRPAARRWNPTGSDTRAVADVTMCAFGGRQF
jgi:hypothetical protein